MSIAEVRVTGISNRVESIREKLPFAIIENGDVVVLSQLEPGRPLNDHLVWLWSMLQHQRKYLKSLHSEGGKLVCICTVLTSEVRLLANAAEMIHLLNMELVLKFR